MVPYKSSLSFASRNTTNYIRYDMIDMMERMLYVYIIIYQHMYTNIMSHPCSRSACTASSYPLHPYKNSDKNQPHCQCPLVVLYHKLRSKPSPKSSQHIRRWQFFQGCDKSCLAYTLLNTVFSSNRL